MRNQKIDINKITQTIKKMADFMNLECNIEAKEDSIEGKRTVTVSVKTADDARFLIGKNGQNLRAFEHILKIIAAKDGNPGDALVLDVNDYRKAQVTRLMELAREAVSHVRNTQKAQALLPMSAYERRIIHMELAAFPDITTESIGTEPQRRIIIKPYP